MAGDFLKLRVNSVTPEAEGINSYELVDPADALLPEFTAGAHLDIHLPGDLIRQYSMCNDPAEGHRYVIAVQREAAGRGGSRAMYEEIKPGAFLKTSRPRNNFPLAEGANRYLLLAGGIGITPLLAMVRRLQHLGRAYVLHYSTRAPERTAFREILSQAPFKDRVVFHHDGGDPSRGLDIKSLLANRADGTELYYCGPMPMMEAIKQAASHWPPDTLHYEYFAAAPGVAPAQPTAASYVRIASTGAVLTVPPDRSILDVVRDAGFYVESSCEEGICGTCATNYLDGEPEHRDQAMTAIDKQKFKLVMICCARVKPGSILTLNL
ncbi:MAG: oxidoreductase [Rhodospirillaceae bacterium]|nr:oxidoreductase [Rhodospirillaceae bacterium]